MSTPPPIPLDHAAATAASGKLRLLGVFHLVLGGVALALYSIPVVHFLLAAVMGNEAPPPTPTEQKSVESTLVATFTQLGVLPGLVLSALSMTLLIAGYCLLKHRNYRYCVAIAWAECLFVPFGTVLGVCSLVVLSKPECKLLFVRR